MRVIYLCSRDWSYSILKLVHEKLREDFSLDLIFVHSKFKKHFDPDIFDSEIIYIEKYSDLDEHLDKIKSCNPNILLGFGWSGYLSPIITSCVKALILHPSNLPKYRGGSPIQNQLINGVKDSAISIIEAVDAVDAGKIYFQSTLNMSGKLSDIKRRIVHLGFIGLQYIYLESQQTSLIEGIEQDESAASYYKRRGPSESEIKLDDFGKFEAEYFYNKVRGLDDDYPRAFIKCKNNTKLFIEEVSFISF